MSGGTVPHKPDARSSRTFCVVQFISVLMPTIPPALIGTIVIIHKYLISTCTIDVEIKAPIDMMFVVGDMMQPPAVQLWIDDTIVVEIPYLVNSVSADSGQDAEF